MRKGRVAFNKKELREEGGLRLIRKNYEKRKTCI